LNQLRPLPLLLVLAACGGASAPPPPVAVASPAATAASDELRPMSSREGAAGTASATAPAGPQGSLPPGHPPIEGAAPAATEPLPAGHPPLGETKAGAKSAGNITGTITLSPKLAVGPSDVMYIMAKKGTATLAVRRVEKPAFPYAFEISGGDAMMGGVAFEGPVDVVARVSRSGDAIPAKGDLEGTAKGLKVPSKGVTLTIDSARQ